VTDQVPAALFVISLSSTINATLALHFRICVGKLPK
jgi:hypothetical protein